MSPPEPDDSHRNRPEGAVTRGRFVVAGGEAAELLAAGDEVLDQMAAAIDGTIERPGAVLVASAGWCSGCRAANSRRGGPGRCSPCRRRPDPDGCGGDPGRAVGPPPAPAADRRRWPPDAGLGSGPASAACHRPPRGDGPSSSSRPGSCPALQSPGPPCAPAACWCARSTVPSTQCTVQSSCPAAAARRWTAAKIRSQTPPSVQRGKRVYTVGHSPYRPGRSRQGHRSPASTGSH
jgi:hypothetical protein